MESFLSEIFNNFNTLILSLHTISNALVVGSLFAIIFIVKPIMYKIKIPGERYGKSIYILKRFMYCIVICMLVVIFSGLVCINGMQYSKGDPTTYVMVNVLEMFWIFIVLNFVYVFFKIKEANKQFLYKDYVQTHENLELIFTYMLPLNFLLSVAGLYFETLIGI